MPKDTGHSLQIGTILNDKWVILEFIAKGGMGEIYRAHQLNLKRDVAIKIVSQEWLNEISEDKEEIERTLKRFRQEVHTMVQIRHPNVIQIYDYDSAQIADENKKTSIEYIVLEYIPGITLRGTMPEEGFYPEEIEVTKWIQHYFLPILDGVEAMHRAGIFHRDLKPENVLMDGDIPKIADFGLARSCRLESMNCSLESRGTPAYMAPEQFIDFKRTDQRTDISALGKILFEAIDGKIPANTIPFKRAGLKEAKTTFFKKVDQIIQRATAEDIRDRFESVEELRDEINDVLATVKPKIHENQTISPKDALPFFHKLRFKPRSTKIWLLSVGVAFLIILSSFGGYHYLGEHGFILFQKKIPAIKGVKDSDGYSVSPPQSLPPRIEAPDGVTLRLISGGTFNVPGEFNNGIKKTVVLKSFYMDETQVTNHQFVIFLNKMLDKIRVEEGAVKYQDQIWLYLGKVMDKYEPVVFSEGRFHVKNSAHAACPVIRVTAYGASAYAQFYKRRLPTKTEWLFTALEGRDPSQVGEKSPLFPDSFLKEIKLPYPVMLFKPNALNIRGMNKNIGEWVLDDLVYSQESDNSTEKYVIVGGFDKSYAAEHHLPGPVQRQPWEAFEKVGFRCVKNAE